MTASQEMYHDVVDEALKALMNPDLLKTLLQNLKYESKLRLAYVIIVAIGEAEREVR